MKSIYFPSPVADDMVRAILEDRCINNYGFYKEWQWRGPQKESENDGQA